MGDFNMHVDNPMDSEGNIFNDTMITYRLKQHVTLPTHDLGNTLDLMFSEITKKINIGKVETGSKLSDHKLVLLCLALRSQPQPERKLSLGNSP